MSKAGKASKNKQDGPTDVLWQGRVVFLSGENDEVIGELVDDAGNVDLGELMGMHLNRIVKEFEDLQKGTLKTLGRLWRHYCPSTAKKQSDKKEEHPVS